MGSCVGPTGRAASIGRRISTDRNIQKQTEQTERTETEQKPETNPATDRATRAGVDGRALNAMSVNTNTYHTRQPRLQPGWSNTWAGLAVQGMTQVTTTEIMRTRRTIEAEQTARLSWFDHSRHWSGAAATGNRAVRQEAECMLTS